MWPFTAGPGEFISVTHTPVLGATPRELLAQGDSQLFLGEDFWPWMVLAFGAAMVVGNVLALLRPPTDGEGRLRSSDASANSKGSSGGNGSGGPADGRARDRPPLGRSIVLIVVGLAAAAWGIASLLA